MNKRTLKEYANGVFPRNLCITRSIDEANELFTCPFTEDGKFERSENALATTYCANYKDRDSGCLLLVINKKLKVGTICHEALHITRTILEMLPCTLSDETEEVWCYLIGWVGNCIDDYLKTEKK